MWEDVRKRKRRGRKRNREKEKEIERKRRRSLHDLFISAVTISCQGETMTFHDECFFMSLSLTLFLSPLSLSFFCIREIQREREKKSHFIPCFRSHDIVNSQSHSSSLSLSPSYFFFFFLSFFCMFLFISLSFSILFLFFSFFSYSFSFFFHFA